MHPVLLLAALLFAPVQNCPTDAQATPASIAPWLGTYQYAESAPPDLVVQYLIRIAPDGTARITADGHMTEIHLAAHAIPQPCDVLALTFDHTLDANSTHATFHRNELLLTLHKRDATYSLRWAALTSQLGNPRREVKLIKTPSTP